MEVHDWRKEYWCRCISDTAGWSVMLILEMNVTHSMVTIEENGETYR